MGRIGLSEQEWGRFFDYLHRIVNGAGTSEERKSEVEDAANIHSPALGDLEEFAAWFTDEE